MPMPDVIAQTHCISHFNHLTNKCLGSSHHINHYEAGARAIYVADSPNSLSPLSNSVFFNKWYKAVRGFVVAFPISNVTVSCLSSATACLSQPSSEAKAFGVARTTQFSRGQNGLRAQDWNVQACIGNMSEVFIVYISSIYICVYHLCGSIINRYYLGAWG